MRGASAARAGAAAAAATKHAGHDSRCRQRERLRYAQRIRDLSVEEHVGGGAAGLSPAAHRGPKLGRFHGGHVFVVECAPNVLLVLDERVVVAFHGRVTLVHDRREQLVHERLRTQCFDHVWRHVEVQLEIEGSRDLGVRSRGCVVLETLEVQGEDRR